MPIEWFRGLKLKLLSPLPSLQACDGTISQLRQYLVEMERFDAVNIIDKALEESAERGVASASTEREQESTSSSSQHGGKSAPGESAKL